MERLLLRLVMHANMGSGLSSVKEVDVDGLSFSNSAQKAESINVTGFAPAK
jgi:hypothetical protein